MNRSVSRLNRETRDSLFPEFRRDEDDLDLHDDVAEEKPAPQKPEPLIFSVMGQLAEVLAEETRLIRAGDFEGFAALQREKGLLIRQAERLEHARGAMGKAEDLDTELVKDRLDGFNHTVEKNMRAIGAVKDAITHVRTQAIRKLEEEKGDGVYARDGEKKSLHHLSLNESKVKL